MDSSPITALHAKLRGLRVAIGDDCVFDFDEQRLWRQGSVVALPPKAFLTLAVLVVRAGHLVEKSELLDAVWGEAHVEEGGLARNVSLLRKALGDDPAHHRVIETVATHGYRFIAPVRPLDQSSPPAGSTVPRAENGAPAGSEAPPASPPAEAHSPPDRLVDQHAAPKHSRRLVAAVALGVLALTGVTVLWNRADSNPHVTDSRALPLVAILPLVDTADDGSEHVFAEGLTAGIAGELGKQRGVRVMSPSLSLPRATSTTGLLVAAGQLGAESVVTGSFDHDGRLLRLDVRLFQVGDAAARWSRHYERPLGELLQLERLVAEDVAAVTVPDHDGGLDLPEARPAHLVDPRLYERYVRARAALDRRTDPDLQTAADAFEELTRIDPEFALAFSGLSQTYLVLMGRGTMSGDEALPRVERAARRALTLDPTLGEPHVSLSAVVAVRSGLDAAIAELELAVDAQPSLALARSRLAETLAFQGRHAEAVPQAVEAVRLDPASPILSSILADLYRQAGQLDRAVETASRLLDQRPDTYVSRMTLGRIHLARGELDDAIRELRLAVESSGRNAAMLGELGYALAKGGHRTEAVAVLAELDERNGLRPVNPRAVALLCWALGDVNRAAASAEKWLASDPSALLLWYDPHYAEFRTDPAIASRLGPAPAPRAP